KMSAREKAIIELQQGGIGVMPTDTLYGLVGSARQPATVEKIYQLKGREKDKPLIVLISSLDDLSSLGVKLTPAEKAVCADYWPGPVSIVLSCPLEKLDYLHRGTKTLASRLPADPDLCSFIRQTGPLVAPSANPAGAEPAQTIKEARGYFGEKIDFYLAGQEPLVGQASKLIRPTADGRIEVLRP
ncbi:MAG: L-threonylcarbamoyladenylate synthase, partial [Candidatus Paceibacterota bacterium]